MELQRTCCEKKAICFVLKVLETCLEMMTKVCFESQHFFLVLSTGEVCLETLPVYYDSRLCCCFAREGDPESWR